MRLAHSVAQQGGTLLTLRKALPFRRERLLPDCEPETGQEIHPGSPGETSVCKERPELIRSVEADPPGIGSASQRGGEPVVPLGAGVDHAVDAARPQATNDFAGRTRGLGIVVMRKAVVDEVELAGEPARQIAHVGLE